MISAPAFTVHGLIRRSSGQAGLWAMLWLLGQLALALHLPAHAKPDDAGHGNPLPEIRCEFCLGVNASLVNSSCPTVPVVMGTVVLQAAGQCTAVAVPLLLSYLSRAPPALY